MNMTQVKSTLSPQELLDLPDAASYELVDGNLVERHTGSESSAVAVAVAGQLANFVRPKRAGHLFTTDCGYRCFPGAPDKVRRPDVSFVRTGRLADERPPEGYVESSPDLVMEVLSPGDLAYEIDGKIEDYLSAGVRLIWVVNPKTRTLRIHRPADSPLGPIGAASETDMITGEDVLPGFECRVAEFFDI